MAGGANRTERHVVAFAGGRGGIGRSTISANIGVYLAQLGKNVVLVDADLGAASQHTILGLEAPRTSLAQIIDRQAEHLGELIVETGVPNLYLLPGAADRFGVANLRPTQKERLLQLFRSIEAEFVLLDVGAGTSFNVLDLFLVADIGVLIALPEPASVEAVYRFVRSAIIRLVRREVGRQTQWPQVLDDTVARLGGLPGPLELRDALVETAPILADLVEAARQRLRPRLIVSRAKVKGDFELGEAMRSLSAFHLGVGIEYLGYIESDDAMWLATRKRRPLMVDAPGAPSAKDIERISRRILGSSSGDRVGAVVSPPKPIEILNHYEVLEVDVGAREDEIRRGYKRQRELYQGGGLAGYSLVDFKVAAAMNQRIQATYDTLLDPKGRKTYDLALPPSERAEPTQRERTTAHEEASSEASSENSRQSNVPPPSRPPDRPPAPTSSAFSPSTPKQPPGVETSVITDFTGAVLRQIRESRGVELRDITARTKIGMSYLKAIEEEDFSNLPALVYTRGFVGEMAKYLQLDHARVVKTYIGRFRKYLEESGKLD